MITVQNVQKRYGEGGGATVVLDSVSLSIDQGEFVAIVGTSGSGKTTLLNTIGGLDSAFEGSVVVDDKHLEKMNEKAIAGMRHDVFGFVFQQFNLLDHLSALENVSLPSFFGNMTPAAASERATMLLNKMGLGDKLSARPPQLSGGQKQRIAIARALFGAPKILLCDEPTGSLDRKTGVEILELFQSLNTEDDLTLIVVTHEEHIARMANRVVRMEDGRIVSDERRAPIRPSKDLLDGGESE